MNDYAGKVYIENIKPNTTWDWLWTLAACSVFVAEVLSQIP